MLNSRSIPQDYTIGIQENLKIGNVFASIEMEEDIPNGNIFVNTVQENMTHYSKRDVKKATEARQLHGTLHFP